jgi:hypothetical protein
MKCCWCLRQKDEWADSRLVMSEKKPAIAESVFVSEFQFPALGSLYSFFSLFFIREGGCGQILDLAHTVYANGTYSICQTVFWHIQCMPNGT